ncbi:glycosyltransferase family A protein [Yimella sp. NH-Cas1]|uniref:glycosyltransferase family 2 protein n=1 Tax=Yimella sp. NH-Cas1 TaxID=2917726 RepID=UPI001EFA6D80|nr:glycosyltransferase family A protein [Yimella sp. NH-Cas1]MCG8654516.1 glycosyltransferase [Yimella sp. NH-Cas1]
MTAVSVVCPVYNRSAALLRTIRSVQEQTLTDWELLLVSDGSTDDTSQIVAKHAADDPRIRWIEHERTGHPSEPRNHGVRQACGDVVAYLDHDDAWEPDHLATITELLGSDADLVATGATTIDENGDILRQTVADDMWWHPDLQALDPLFEPSRIAHRAGLLQEHDVAWRDPEGLEDWDLLFRLSHRSLTVRTHERRTAVITEHSSSRRMGMRPPWFAAWARSSDPSVLARLMRLLRRPDTDSRIRLSADEARARRIASLSASPVRPVRPVPACAPSRPDDGTPRRWGPALSILPVRSGVRPQYALVRPVYCSGPEHAAAFAAAHACHLADQHDLLGRLLRQVDPRGAASPSNPPDMIPWKRIDDRRTKEFR